ncbi:MAG TPA: TlpA disulfide reductase family protein [Gemmatimonadales bacterium]
MSRFSRLRRLLTPERIGWALLVGFLAWRLSPQAGAAFGFTALNQAAPDFRVTTLEGEPVTLDSLRGQVVLLNFWATWCPPCRVEMPGFQDVYEERRGEGFVVLGVSTDAAGRRPVVDFLREKGITYPVAMANGEIVNAYGGARVLPTSFLIDRDGLIRHEVRGYFSEVALRKAVGRLLDEEADGDVAARARSGRVAVTTRRSP